MPDATPTATTPEPAPGTSDLSVRELDASTWDAFAELVERNNGIFGGCWCIGWHPECGQRGTDRVTGSPTTAPR